MKKFLFYFLILIFLAVPLHAIVQTQTTQAQKQDEISQTITLINQAKYDAALRQIYSVQVPQNKEDKARYYLTKIKALERTPYRANTLVESETDPTKFTNQQKQNAIKQSYKELWALRSTLINMPYVNYKQYLSGGQDDTVYDALVNRFISQNVEPRIKVYEESFKLAGENREGIREHWHIQYVLVKIDEDAQSTQKTQTSNKEKPKELAALFAVISGQNQKYSGQFKKYFFSAQTARGKYEAALQSINYYRQAEDFYKAHSAAEYCEKLDVKNNTCKSIKQDLERPSAYLTNDISYNQKPNTVLPIKFKANNIKQINFKLYKLTLKQAQENNDFKNLTLYKTYPQNLTYDTPYTPKDFTFDLPALERGFYRITLEYAGKQEYDHYGYNFNVTDLALLNTTYFNTDNLDTLKYNGSNIHFYAFDQNTGALLPNTNIKADKVTNGWPQKTIGQLNIQTDANGQANVKSTYTLEHIAAKYKNNYALISSVYPPNYYKPMPYRIYMNTDRSIYKPGEEVQMVFNIVELKDNKFFTYSGKQKLNIKIHNPSYKEVGKADLPLDDFGQATYTFKVPKDTMLGMYRVQMSFGDVMQSNDFQVEEFKQPEFTLTLNAPDDVYSFNENISIVGKAAYYSGENLAKAHVKYTITKVPFYPCCFRWNGFVYEEEPAIYEETQTDKDGVFKINFTPKAKKEKDVLPARYLIKAEVLGANGHTISGETSISVSAKKYFFNIEKNKNFLLTDTTNYLKLNMLSANGKAQKGKADFELFEAKVKDGKVPNISNLNQDDFDLAKEPVFKTGVNFDGNEISQKLPILKEGFYAAKLTIGQEESQVFIFPIFDGKKPSLEVQDGITLTENKEYIVGENAKILLGASKAKGPKIVEIYKNGFLVKRLILGNSPLQFITLPITADYQGGLSVNWLSVYDYKHYGGSANISVAYIDKNADVKLTVPENLEPGQTAQIALEATVSKKPLQNARAIITVYDKALDYYREHNFNLYSPYSQTPVGILRPFGLIKNMMSGGRSGMMAMAKSANMDFAAGSAMEESLNMRAAAPAAAAEFGQETNPVRADFAPTAYFNPKANLQNGKAAFNFKMPDSLTEWTAAAIVFSKTMQTGKTQVNFVTRKDLTLRLETPTFLRQNDEIVFTTLIKNNTKNTLQSTVNLTLKVNGETAENAFEIKQISLKPGQEITLAWPYTAPKELGEITLTAVARSEKFTDGETRTLPLLTSLQYLPNSKTISLREGENVFQLAPVKEGEILNAAHLTVDTSLVVPVISAIPMLSEQNFKTAIGTIDRYLPLAIVNQLYNTNASFRKAAAKIKRDTSTEKWNKQTSEILIQDTELSPWYNISKGGQAENNINIFSAATVAKKQKNYLEELKKYQNSDGGFAWIKGGKSSLYITLYVVDRLAQASYFGVKPPMDITQNALKYLKAQYKNFDLSKGNYPFEAIYFAYVLSAFDKTLLVQDTRQKVQTLADYIDKQKEILAPLGQVYMAIIYNRLGNTQKANKYIKLLFETAKENDTTGISFAMEERSWQWFKDDLNLHAEALKMLLEVQPNSPKIAGLIKWLMFNKKATMWGSTTNAAKAVYALLEAIKDWGVLGQNKNYNIAWNGQNYDISVGALAKESNTVFSVYEPQANNSALTAKIKLNTTNAQGQKATKTLPSFATLSNLVISSLPQAESPKGVLNISKAYYLIEGNTVRALKENETVKVGSKIEVRLTVQAEHNFDFVLIQDRKPAAFDTEKLLSGWVWEGLTRYEDLQLAQTNFFMDYIPVGTYELKYILRPTAEGVFNVGAGVIQSMFAPEVSAHSNSFIIKVEK